MSKQPTDEAIEFSTWLASAITEANISRREAARRIARQDDPDAGDTDVETVRGSLYKWLRGDNTPSLQRRVEIGQALGGSVPRASGSDAWRPPCKS